MVRFNSTKYTKSSTQGRRDDYINRITETPLAINAPSEPKSLVSAKSKGPNTEANVTSIPNPNETFLHDDRPHIPSALDKFQQTIHITSDEVRSGDGRILYSYSDGSSYRPGTDDSLVRVVFQVLQYKDKERHQQKTRLAIHLVH